MAAQADPWPKEDDFSQRIALWIVTNLFITR